MKQEKDTAWYRSYKDLAAAFTNFIIDNEVGQEEWKGAQKAEDFFGAQSGLAFAQRNGVDSKSEANSLLAQIQA